MLFHSLVLLKGKRAQNRCQPSSSSWRVLEGSGEFCSECRRVLEGSEGFGRILECVLEDSGKGFWKVLESSGAFQRDLVGSGQF